MAADIPTDHESIMLAYQQQLQAMFQVFFNSSLVDDMDNAAARFAKGLAALKAARDKAMTIVP